MATVNLMHGECLSAMEFCIEDASVDMVLCDLPYGTTACSWDTIIDLPSMWSQYRRILKPNAAAVLFGAEPFSSKLRVSNIEDFKYDWIWRKSLPGGFAQAKNMPLKQHEVISVFSRGASTHAVQSKNRITYNPQDLVHRPSVVRNAKRHLEESAFGNRPSHKDSYVQEFTNYPNSILEFQVERGFHPTQKPVELMRYLIRTYTNAGDTVLDNTMGSGTTGVAAVLEGRNFIGIELNDEYFAIAQRRIAEAQASV